MQNTFDLINKITDNILPFILVLTRIGAVFFTIPPFMNNNIPGQVKALFTLAFALAIFPLSAIEMDLNALSYFDVFSKIASEFIFGLIIAFMVTIVFTGVQVAGRFIDLNSGFGFSNIVDPMTQEEVTITSRFYFICAVTIFFVIGGHSFLIRAIAESYNFIPIGQFGFNSQTAGIIMRSFGDIFIIGFKIAIPVMASLFLTEVALAILSRAIPQIQVFLLGFPLKISVTFIVIALTLINTVPYLQSLFEDSFVNIDYIMKTLRN